THNEGKDCDDIGFIGDVSDFSKVVKEGWINVVTAGREQDDASFTTKVVVPVGESYIVAGETQVALDVPAYVNAAGYTMLPVRAVAVALGINTQNVLWDQATKTVTILYGQRIITMQVGAKVVYVNGSAIPSSASVEIVNGRTFLPMRDLATALGVTDITWDAATKTATLNGSK
ncbi:MAG: copper amine oxidase N-terminal domain-containing protein, partial [Anaerotignum sp.]|nr:copper amine oxidase N-terminal domain-containing protein [Anaerotignum sp.]